MPNLVKLVINSEVDIYAQIVEEKEQKMEHNSFFYSMSFKYALGSHQQPVLTLFEAIELI